jgi:hypothetical protein
MVAEDDKAIYFRFGTELTQDWEAVFDRIHGRARRLQDDLNRQRFKVPTFDTADAEKAYSEYLSRMAKSQRQSLTDQEREFREFARELIATDEEIAKAQEQANKEKEAAQLKWGARLAKQIDKDLKDQEAAQMKWATRLAKQLDDDLKRQEAAKMKWATQLAKELDRQLADEAKARDKAEADKLSAQMKWGERLAKEIDRELAARKKAEADFVKDSQQLAESLANAWGEWNAKQAAEAEATMERSSKAIESGNKKIEDSLLKTGKGALEVARGLTYLGAVAEDDAERILKVIVRFEAFHSVAKGSITVLRNLTEVWKNYRDVRAAAAAIEAAGGAASAARGAGSALGAGVGAAVGAGAGAAGGSAGGLLAGAAGAVGGAAGIATLGVAAIAAAGVVGTLYYFDKNFKAGVDKFLFGMTDAEQKLLKRIQAGESEASELRQRFGKDQAYETQLRGLAGEGAGYRARAEILADKSIPLEERGLRADELANSRQIRDTQRQLEAARAAAASAGSNASENPGNQSALAQAELTAQSVVEITQELKRLEQERLSIVERSQQVAVDGARKQLDAAKETAAQARQIADEAQRAADIERDKYSSDLARFGQANPIEQEKLRRIKGKLDAGETLTAEESRIASGYNEFADQAAAADRSRAIAAGGEALFAGGEARAVDAQAQAAASNAAALGAQGNVAKIESEIRILMEANTQELARQVAEQLEPLQEQLVQAIVDQAEKKRLADAKAAADRRTKEGIQAGRS